MLSHLEEEIGYFFRDRNLLRRAMTHRSYANEQADPRPPHNEALEFLGDAVLEFLISAWLLELYPTQTEGTLSKMRAYTVSAVNLQKQAARLRLGSYLLLNRGEEKTGSARGLLRGSARRRLPRPRHRGRKGFRAARVRRHTSRDRPARPYRDRLQDRAARAPAIGRAADASIRHRREPRPRPSPRLPCRTARQRPMLRDRRRGDHQRRPSGRRPRRHRHL